MKDLLVAIAAAIEAPSTTWRREPEPGMNVFHGDADLWRLLVVSQDGRRMGTATHLKQLLIVKMTDELTETAYAAALKGAP